MSVLSLLQDLVDRGIRVRVEGDRLVAKAPPGTLTPELADRVRTHKQDLIEYLRGARSTRLMQGSMRGLAVAGNIMVTPAQRRYWELQRLDPQSTAYLGPGAFRLEGPLDPDALKSALQAIVDRHDILRYRFSEADGEPRIHVAESVVIRLETDDLSGEPDQGREQALRRYLEEAAEEPMDLEAGPPVRFRLIRLGPEEHALFLLTHSTVWDGWSFDLFLAELKAHYEAELEGRPAALPPLEVQYPDYAAWIDQRMQEGAFDDDLAYWRRILRGPIPRLDLPSDRPRSPVPDYRGDRVEVRIKGPLLQALRELAAGEGASTYMVMLTALNVLLHRYTGLEDILVSSPLQGRGNQETEHVIGLFTNTLFFRNRVEPAQSFRSLLREVRDRCLEAVDHQDVPAELVVREKEAEGSGWGPYDVIYVYQQATARPSAMGPVSVRSIIRGTRHVQVDLLVWSREHADYLDGGFDFRTSLFDRERMERMVGHLQAILDSATLHPDRGVGDLDLLTPEDRSQLETWGAPEPGLPEPRQGPHSGHLVVGDRRLDPNELDEGVGRVAGQLRAALVPAGVNETGRPAFALPLDGSLESVLAVLAARDLDADVLPISGGSATRRAEAAAAAAALPLVLSSESPLRSSGLRVPMVVLEAGEPSPLDDASDGAAVPGDRVAGILSLPDAAGGEVRRRPWPDVDSRARALAAHAATDMGAGVALYLDGPAEAALEAILAVLTAGGRLYLPEPHLPLDGWELDERVTNGEVQVVIAGSVALHELVSTGWESPVERVLCCDPFPPTALASAVDPLCRSMELGFGAPGLGGWVLLSSHFPDDPAASRFRRLARHRPVRVTDRRGRLVPIGVRGDLYLDEDTAGPVRGIAARWTPAGDLLLETPVRQVAVVNGVPVDIEALEEAASAATGSTEARALLVDAGEETVLTLHVAGEGAGQSPDDGLRLALSEAGLPSGIRITVFGYAALPRSESGRVDDRVLRRVAVEGGKRAPAALGSDAERLVAAAWQEHLGIAEVSPLDNFFELGGHSLMAAQVTAQLERKHGLRIDPRSLFFQNLRQVAASAGAPATTGPPSA